MCNRRANRALEHCETAINMCLPLSIGPRRAVKLKFLIPEAAVSKGQVNVDALHLLSVAWSHCHNAADLHDQLSLS